MHRLVYLFACCMLLASPLVVSAQALYRVELIIFEHKGAAGLAAEHWPNDESALPSFSNAVSLTSSTGLSVSPEKLNDIANKLNASPAYRVLFHTAWKQAVLDAAATKGIRLTNGRTMTANDTATVDEVDGITTLSAGRFLHLNLDLVFSKLLPGKINPVLPNESAKEAQIVRRFQLKEARRIKSKELNYFDHPLFGAIVLVTPVAQGQ